MSSDTEFMIAPGDAVDPRVDEISDLRAAGDAVEPRSVTTPYPSATEALQGPAVDVPGGNA